MKKACKKLHAAIVAVQKDSGAEIQTMYARWIDVPSHFGNPLRTRLFSPLTHLLALPLTGART